MTDPTYAFNSLTNFESIKRMQSPENDFLKIREITLHTIFSNPFVKKPVKLTI